MPDCGGNTRGLLKIPPGLGEKALDEVGAGLILGEAVTARLLVIVPNVCLFEPFASDDGDRAIFASELAVGANNLEDTLENLEELEPAADDLEATDFLPATFLTPMLPTSPMDDIPVADESRVPMEDTLVGLRALLAAVPAIELILEPGDKMELVRLIFEPALLCKLFRLEPAGSGERTREDVAMEPLVDERDLVSSAFGLASLILVDSPWLPLATAALARGGATEDFLVGTNDGGPILSLTGSGFAVGEAFGI